MSFPFLDVLKFQYLTIELNKLNWREFIRRDNPVAGALLSKMGYNDNEKIKVKKEFIQMLARMELDPTKTEILLGFFETYLRLNQEEENKLQAEFENLNGTEAKVMEIISSYRREGRIEGKKEGKLEGKRDSICTF